jgi:hypothetical protein
MHRVKAILAFFAAKVKAILVLAAAEVKAIRSKAHKPKKRRPSASPQKAGRHMCLLLEEQVPVGRMRCRIPGPEADSLKLAAKLPLQLAP